MIGIQRVLPSTLPRVQHWVGCLVKPLHEIRMIISHRHKFIFLKTSKTAGTSIEIALSQICGEEDVITPLAKEDEELRRLLSCRSSQNYLPELSRLRQRPNRQLTKQEGFFNHMPGHRSPKPREPRGLANIFQILCGQESMGPGHLSILLASSAGAPTRHDVVHPGASSSNAYAKRISSLHPR